MDSVDVVFNISLAIALLVIVASLIYAAVLYAEIKEEDDDYD